MTADVSILAIPVGKGTRRGKKVRSELRGGEGWGGEFSVRFQTLGHDFALSEGFATSDQRQSIGNFGKTDEIKKDRSTSQAKSLI